MNVPDEQAAPTLFDDPDAAASQAAPQDVPPPAQSTTAEADSTSDATPRAALPMDARRALVMLLKHGVVLARTHRAPYRSLLRHREAVSEQLANLFLRVLIDEQAGLMLLQQIDEADLAEEADEQPEITSLLPAATLSLFDSLLVLVLRRYHQEREKAGEQRVFIDVERIESRLRPYLPLVNYSQRDRKQLNGALKRLQDRRLLGAERGADDRYEVSPVIRHVVSAAVLESLLERYRTLAAEGEARE